MRVLVLGLLVLFASILSPTVHAAQKSVFNPPGNLTAVEVPIANNTTDSAEIDLGGFVPVGITLPAGVDATAIKFSGRSDTSITAMPVYNASGELSVTVAASRYVALNPADFYGVRYLTVKMGTTQSPALSIVFSLRSL